MEQEDQYQYDLALERMKYEKAQADQADRQAEIRKQKESRMGWSVFLIALLLSLIADVVELFTLGTIGWLVGLVIDFILVLILGVSKAGRKQFKKWIWGPLIEKIPIISAIPLFRVGFLIWAFISSRSEKLQAISHVVSKIAKK
jgi:hypothetical protein